MYIDQSALTPGYDEKSVTFITFQRHETDVNALTHSSLYAISDEDRSSSAHCLIT